jgi:Na+/melibiose symporter-like transporter
MNSIVLRGAGIFGNIFGGYLPYMIRFFRPELGDVAVYRTIFAISWVVMAIAVYQLFKLEDTEGREVEEEKELEQELEANGEREDLRARKQQQEDELDLSTAGPMTRFLHYLEIPLESARFLVKYIMAEGLLALGAGFFLPFMTMYFIRIFDASYEAVGWIRSFSQLMVITGLALVPWLSKRFGTVNSIFATRLIAVPLILGIAYAPNLWWVAAAFALRNTFQRMGQPLRQKFMMGNLDREKRATATGVHRTVGRVFRAVAVGTAGLVITRLSYTTAFWIGFGAYGVSCLLFYLFFVRDEEYRNYTDRKKMMDRVASG